MLYYENQLNLGDFYKECSDLFTEQKPEFLELLNKYIDINKYIPYYFKKAFYANTSRPRGYSLYGYTTPSKNLRLSPGTILGTEELDNIYKICVAVDKSINHFKSNIGIASRKTRNTKTTKADILLAGIVHLFTVIIANAMSKPEYIKSIKSLQVDIWLPMFYFRFKNYW